jgi:hypothetical protein
MASDTKTAAYAAMVVEAETAVAAVKDPELRRVAFEKILATLLEEPTSSTDASCSKRRPPAPSAEGRPMVKGAIKKSRKGPKAYLEELIEDDFFKKQRTIVEVKAELANRGHHIAFTSLSGPLQRLTQERRLRRQKAGTNSKGAKSSYAYSNW